MKPKFMFWQRPQRPKRHLITAWPGLALLFLMLASWHVQADNPASVKTDHAEVSLIAAETHVIPSAVQNFALVIKPEEGWYTYWRNPGEVGKATSIEWELPKGVKAGEIEWPLPTRKVEPGGVSLAYTGTHVLPVSMAVGTQLDFDRGPQTFVAHANWLICKDLCIPEQATLRLSLPIANPSASRASLQSPDQLAINNAIARTPVLRRDIKARYALTNTPSKDDAEDVRDNLVIQIDAVSLPAFTQRPTAFIGEQGLVNEAILPSIELSADTLSVQFKKDPYLDEAPAFHSLILSGLDSNKVGSGAIELHVEYDPDLKPSGAIEDAGTNGAILATDSKTQSTNTAGLLPILLFAFLGGLILNAMPCVLPVLSLKIMGLVESSHSDSRTRQLHGIYYTAGVLLSFLLVAIALISLRALGEQIGWGFQMQSPPFVAFMAVLIFVLGLSMSGFVEFGSNLQNLGGDLVNSNKKPLAGSFWTGVLATVVATPCTAPFMGSAIGYALSQPAWVSLTVFAAMALGLASPFLLIAFVPTLQKILPKPGNWMNTFKELMAFPLYLTAIWLLWVFSRQTGNDALALLLVAMVFTTMAFWAWNKLSAARLLSQGTGVWKIVTLLLAVCSITGIYFASTSAKQVDAVGSSLVQSDERLSQAGEFSAYSPEVLQAALDAGQTVLVNMTADWCITCKVNERTALKTKPVLARFADEDVTYIKGDWTNSDPSITQYLESFKRNGVPLYVVYKPGQEPKVLPQILTANLILDEIN